MTEKLDQLITEGKKMVSSSKDREEQRRSFAYGNTKIENSRITRELIDREAESLRREAECVKKK
jgi:hypothetical protein